MYISFAVASLYLLDRDKYDAKTVKLDKKGLEIKNPYKGYVRVRNTIDNINLSMVTQTHEARSYARTFVY